MYSRCDRNHIEIVAILKQVGATVQDLSQVGGGCPDIICGWRGANYFFEIKDKNGKLNKKQQLWHENWRGQIHVIRDEYEAFAAMGIEDKALISRYCGI